MGTNVGGSGGFVKIPPKLVSAKFNIIFKSPKLISAKYILFFKLTFASSDTDSEWEDSSEDFELNAVDLILDDELGIQPFCALLL